MMSKAVNAPSSPRYFVAWLRLLVLLPLFLLRDSSARTTWPSPVELENTIARIAHPAAFIPDDADGISSVSFFDPAPVGAATKRGWQWTPDSRVIAAAPAPAAAPAAAAGLSSATRTELTGMTGRTAGTGLTAVPPANPPPHPALTPVHPARTLAALQRAPRLPASPSGGVQPAQHAQLAAHWRNSPQLRDRFLASLWGNPAPTAPRDPAAPEASTFRSPSLGDPATRAALDAQLSFNPLTVVSGQLRAFATDPALTAEFTADPAIRREYNFLGCRLPGRAAELRLGLMDLAEKQFRLNPGNVRSEESRQHTATVSARFKF